MKKINAAVISVLFIFMFTFSYAAGGYAAEASTATEPLSLQEALNKAYQNNATLRTAELNLEQAAITRDDTAELVNAMYLSGPVSTTEATVINNAQQANINYNLRSRAVQRTKDSVTVNVIQAYTSLLNLNKQLENLQLQINQMDQKNDIMLRCNALGLVSNYDANNYAASRKQLQESYTAVQLSYKSAAAALRQLVNESDSWNPVLTSQPVLASYTRDDLALEISRGLAQSDSVYSAKAALDIQNSKADWILAGTTTEQQIISSDLASISYEQAKDAGRTQIEQLYYTIDSLESGIRTAQLKYDQAAKNLQIAELKYELGLLPMISVSDACLNDYRLAEKTAQLDLEKQKISLAANKAQFAYLTGQAVYDTNDWENF